MQLNTFWGISIKKLTPLLKNTQNIKKILEYTKEKGGWWLTYKNLLVQYTIMGNDIPPLKIEEVIPETTLKELLVKGITEEQIKQNSINAINCFS